MRLPTTLGGAAPLATIRDEEVTNRRRMTLSAEQPEFPPSANYQEFAFPDLRPAIRPEPVDHRIPLGAVEEWTIVNEHDNDHVFHIHTNPFQMVAINGVTLTRAELARHSGRAPQRKRDIPVSISAISPGASSSTAT